MAGLTAYPACATEQIIRPEFDLDDGEESKRGRLRSLRLMHYMKRLEDNAPMTQADSKGEQRLATKAAAASEAGGQEGTVFDSVVQLTSDLRITKTPEDTTTEEEANAPKPPEVLPGKMHLPPHWRHAGPSEQQQAALDKATAEVLKSIHGDAVNVNVNVNVNANANAKKPADDTSEGDIPID